MPELLQRLVKEQVAENGTGKSSRMMKESKIAELDMDTIEDENRPGKPSQFGCPECGGVLWELDGEQMVRFRCRVGHAYAASSLGLAQFEEIEKALWAAMRGLEEAASLARRMAERTERSKHPRLAQRYRARAEAKMEQAELLRKLIVESRSEPV